MNRLLNRPYMRGGSLVEFQPDASTVLWLPCQEGSGTTVWDKSGQGNNGTISESTWVRLNSGIWVLNFDGDNDKITCSLPTSSIYPLTISCWARMAAIGFTTNSGTILQLGTTSNGITVLVGHFVGNGLAALFNLVAWVGASSFTATQNVFFKISATVAYEDATHVRFILYANGLSVLEDVYANPLTPTTAFYLGSDGTTTNTWNGDISIPSLELKVVSASEQLYRYQQDRYFFGV